ncbi:hypothetical protein D6833_00965 [Candidatus Parcubacteria bacterium]|nr:MAG: hypothetical protein D6833_00965 [Candidatus Parcubacteria bacterium]
MFWNWWHIALLGAVLVVGVLSGMRGVFAVNTTPTTQVVVGNAAPVVSNVVLNHGNAITLTANATTAVDINFTVTDQNGCVDVFTGGHTTSTAYRSGVGSNCTADNRYCYVVATTTNDCSGSSATANATATVYLYYFAQATDASSSFPAQNWLATVAVSDTSGATSSATSAGVELNTLTAINVQSSTIDYGTIAAGASSTGDIAVPFDNVGNSSTSLQLSGTAMSSGSDTIATSSQEYATSTFSVGSGTSLSGTPTDVPGTTITAPTSTNPVSQPIYWGILIPGGTATGTYTGTNTYTPVFQP